VTGGKTKTLPNDSDFASLKQRFLANLKKHGMMRPGDRVGVAVSGGADSVALLLLMLELRKKLGIVLSVVHFNHKLRGKASDADEAFVAKLAAKHGLEFHLQSADVADLASRAKANIEEAARLLRRGFFWELAQNGKLACIAVAHTADDQAETVLGHILRGTGLTGLGGIHPFFGPVVRPLLEFRRRELRSYLKSRGQGWREDATNRDESRFRARIRRRLIPLLEMHFQEEAVAHVVRLSELAREDEAFLDALVELRVGKLVRGDFGNSRIGIQDLLHPLPNWKKPSVRQPYQRRARLGKGERAISLDHATELWRAADHSRALRAMIKRLVRRIAKSVKLDGGEWSSAHVDSVLELAERGRNGQSISLPGHIEVRRDAKEIHFRLVRLPWEQLKEKKAIKREFEHPLLLGWEPSDLETMVRVPEAGCVFRFRVIDWPLKRGETSKDGVVLDRDQLRLPILLRNWRPGDRLRPRGHRSAHKLKRLLNEKHISRWERGGWPVLTSGGVVIWARGFPVDAEFAANERTRAGIVMVEEKI
jgi:tRNA(Ile)-lysidine synthase